MGFFFDWLVGRKGISPEEFGFSLDVSTRSSDGSRKEDNYSCVDFPCTVTIKSYIEINCYYVEIATNNSIKYFTIYNQSQLHEALHKSGFKSSKFRQGKINMLLDEPY